MRSTNNNTRMRNLAKARVIGRKDACIFHGGMQLENRFDLLREELHPCDIDNVFHATTNEQTTVTIEFSDVSGVEPTIAQDGRSFLPRVVVCVKKSGPAKLNFQEARSKSGVPQTQFIGR